MRKKFLAFLLSLCMITTIGSVTAIAEDSEKGTASNPYTLSEFNALEQSVTGDVYVTLGDISTASFEPASSGKFTSSQQKALTIGSDKLVDVYAGELMAKDGTFDESGKFTVNSGITIPEEYKYLLENVSRDTSNSNLLNEKIPYYDSSSPAKGHLTLHIVDGSITTGSNTASDINDTTVPIINIMVQDNADIVFENVTINGCFSIVCAYRQSVTLPVGYTLKHNLLHTVDSLTFKNCTFNGVLFSGGGICSYGINAREMAFDNCTFEDFYNVGGGSNPIWVQHTRVLEKLTIQNCSVTSTRPINFEGNIENSVEVTITGNTFNMLNGGTHTTADDANKNAALMFGANSSYQFGSINISNNTLVTAPGVHQQLISLNGGTIGMTPDAKMTFNNNVDGSGNLLSGTELIDAWNPNGQQTDALETYIESYAVNYVATTATVTNSDGFISQYATLQDAVDNVENGDTITVISENAGNATVTGAKYFKLVYDESIAENERPIISVEAGYELNIDSNGNVTVSRPVVNVPDTYDIALTVSDGGSAKTSLGNASAGTTITVSATPDEGYELAYITVDGERISGNTFTMPAHDVAVRVYFTETGAMPFTDVGAGAWYYDAVSYVYANGLMDGVSDTLFNPNGNMTRAMVWAILARIDGQTVTGSNWAEAARTWAVSNGISDGENANGLVTREQLATMLWRYAGEAESSYDLGAFTDAAGISDWAVTAMRWAVENGLITGVSAATLDPAGSASRAQCAAILMRYTEA